MEFVQDVTFHRRALVDVPESAAQFVASIVDNFPSPILSKDAIPQLLEDVVAKEDPNLGTLKDLNIESSSLDQHAFDYLHRFRPGGHFTLVKGYH